MRGSPANANGESPLRPVATFDDGHLAAEVASRAIEDLMRVAMLGSREAVVRVRVRGPVVGVAVGHDGRVGRTGI